MFFRNNRYYRKIIQIVVEQLYKNTIYRGLIKKYQGYLIVSGF